MEDSGQAKHVAIRVENMQPFSTTAVGARVGRERFRLISALSATLKVAAFVALTNASMNVVDGMVVSFGDPVAVPAHLAGEGEKYEVIPMRGDYFWRYFTHTNHYKEIENLEVGGLYLARVQCPSYAGRTSHLGVSWYVGPPLRPEGHELPSV